MVTRQKVHIDGEFSIVVRWSGGDAFVMWKYDRNVSETEKI